MHSKQRISGEFRSGLRKVAAVISLAIVMMPTLASLAALADVTGAAGVIGLSSKAYAQDPTCADIQPGQQPPEGQENLPPCLPDQTNDVASCPEGSCIFETYINPAIIAVSALVGIGVTISIIVGGIQYATSADSPQKVSAAKQRIVKSIFILLAYFFFFAFLQWVIPGGIMGGP